MTGSQLIGLIIEKQLEDYEIGVYREGLNIDWFLGGVDVEINEEEKTAIL